MKQKTLKYIGLFSLLSFLLLNAVLSVLSVNISFTLFAFGYILIVVVVGLFIEKRKRAAFKSITYLFFLVYSIFAVVSYFVIYENPIVDHLGDVDQIGYYKWAVYFSSLSFSEIWTKAFTEFQYSEAPLFNAWIGTLQKISGLDTYFGALFQKLNVVFFSGFIPAILYLMIEKVTGERKVGIKWAIIFGLLSFFFYYSGILLRDIHLALLYTWAFYLILKEDYSFSIYLTLVLLGLGSYFLRVESGLFFLGFYGIWLLRSNSKKKWLIGVLTVPAITLGVIYIGGIENLLARTLGTIQGYEVRGLRAASEDSLAANLSRLPVPFNWLTKFGYSQIYPFPIWSIFEAEVSKNIFHLPRMIGAFFWIFVWTHIVVNYKKARVFLEKYKWLLLLSIGYVFIVSQGQPYERRLFQTYPMIMVLLAGIGRGNLSKTSIYFVAFYATILILYLILKFL